MKKQNKSLTSARILFIFGLVFIVLGAALFLIGKLMGKPLMGEEADLYVGIAMLGVAFVLFLVSGFVLLSASKKRSKEEQKVISDISLAEKGEKVFVEERGQYFGEVAKSINRSRLLRENKKYPYGIYKEAKFDEIVLSTLEDEVLAKAGLAYFVMVSEHRPADNKPRDALLAMLQDHFGEHAYYGKLSKGIAVFVPVLASREEFLGRIKRTVQLFSYTEYGDKENHINVKAGVVFYPDFAPRLLTSEALKGTLEQLALSVRSNEETAPHLGYDAAEKEAFLLHKARFLDALEKAKTLEEADDSFRQFAKAAYPYASADSLGILLYDRPNKAFDLLLEESKEEGESFSLLAENGKLSEDLVMPFYEWSREEKGVAGAGDRTFLRKELSTPLDAMKANSVLVLGVSVEDRPAAVLYLTSREKNAFTDNRLGFEFLSVSQMFVFARKQLERKMLGGSREDIILSSFGHYAYGVSSGSYSLSYVSPNLAKAIPDAQVGKTCYEVLFGRKKACKNCPLLQNNVEKMFPRLASGVFAYKPVQGENETILVLSQHKADFSPSRIDPLTGLLSDKSLHEDLQSEILIKDSHGIILSFRIRNLDAIKSLIRAKEPDEIIKAVSDLLSSSGLGRDLYRFSDTAFAYLLPFATKEEGRALAEKVCRLFANKLPFMGKEVEFVLDYALVSYPLEAETPFALDAILRVLYQKADAASRGRLFEVENEKGSLVDMDYFLKTKLEEGLRASRLPVRYSPYEELAGKNLAFLRASVTVDGENGLPIDVARVQEAVKGLDKDFEVGLAETSVIAKFLGTNRDALSGSSIHGAILPVGPACLTAQFIDRVEGILSGNKASKGDYYLEVNYDDVSVQNFGSFIQEANKKGVRVGLAGYHGGLEEKELKKFSYVSFSAKEIYGGGKRNLLLSLASVRKLGLNILVTDVRDNEERRYLGSLSFHYGRKEDSPWFKEDEVVFSA